MPGCKSNNHNRQRTDANHDRRTRFGRAQWTAGLNSLEQARHQGPDVSVHRRAHSQQRAARERAYGRKRTEVDCSDVVDCDANLPAGQDRTHFLTNDFRAALALKVEVLASVQRS